MTNNDQITNLLIDRQNINKLITDNYHKTVKTIDDFCLLRGTTRVGLTLDSVLAKQISQILKRTKPVVYRLATWKDSELIIQPDPTRIRSPHLIVQFTHKGETIKIYDTLSPQLIANNLANIYQLAKHNQSN